MDIALELRKIARRKPGALSIIGAVSGLGEKRVREIAKGREPTFEERKILEVLAEAK